MVSGQKNKKASGPESSAEKIIEEWRNAKEAEKETPPECKGNGTGQGGTVLADQFALPLRTEPKRETAIIPQSIARSSTICTTKDLDGEKGQTNLDLTFLPFDSISHGFLEIYDFSGDTLTPISEFSPTHTDKILFNELLSMPQPKISSSTTAIELDSIWRTLEDLKEVLFGDSKYNPWHHKEAILSAVNGLASRWLLCPDGLAINAVVADRWNFSATRENEPLVELRRNLPPGNHRGSLIHALTARKYLAKRPRLFRAYCLLAIEWNKFLTKGGRTVQIMRKAYIQPKTGHIIYPNAKEYKQIQPESVGFIPRMVVNPDLLILPEIRDPFKYFYTADEIRDRLTVYPGMSKKEKNRVYQRRIKVRKRVDKWLDEMVKDRAISLIKNRIFPGRNLRLYWPNLPAKRRR